MGKLQILLEQYCLQVRCPSWLQIRVLKHIDTFSQQMIKTLEIRQITATPVGYSLTSIYLFTLVLLVNIVLIKMKLFTY